MRRREFIETVIFNGGNDQIVLEDRKGSGTNIPESFLPRADELIE